jgi:hypothetical protein
VGFRCLAITTRANAGWKTAAALPGVWCAAMQTTQLAELFSVACECETSARALKVTNNMQRIAAYCCTRDHEELRIIELIYLGYSMDLNP